MRLVIAFLLFPLIAVYGWQLFDLILQIDFNSQHQLAFCISFGTSSAVFFWRLKASSFFVTFEHEFTHNLWAFLTFNKPRGFHVYKNGEGSFEYMGKGNFIITLSPYFFPTLAFIFLPFGSLLKDEVMLYFFIVLGVLVGYHIASTVKETHLQQSDIKKYGYLFSFTVIVLGNILCYGILISYTQGSWAAIAEFMKDGVLKSRDVLALFSN